MAKDKTIYVCSQCGNDSPKWVGKCPACGAWNAYVEQVVRKESPMQQARAASIGAFPTGKAVPRPFKDIETGMEVRIDMNDEELNRVLGGGLVPGSLVLLGGEPGIGKSTLILQTVLHLTDKRILYVSGEESPRQLKLRAERIEHTPSDDCLIVCETSLEQIYTHIKNVNHRLHTDHCPRNGGLFTRKHYPST